MRWMVFCGLCLTTTLVEAGKPGPELAQKQIEEMGGRLYRDGKTNQVISITLKGRSVTDDDLPLVLAFPSVQDLDLRDSEITDRGLQMLLPLENLEELNVERTRVTKTAVDAFKDQHPKVYFVSHERRVKPLQLALSAIFLFPMLLGVWFIRSGRKKQKHLSQSGFANITLLGFFLIIGSGLLMVITILQGLGIPVTVSNLFG